MRVLWFLSKPPSVNQALMLSQVFGKDHTLIHYHTYINTGEDLASIAREHRADAVVTSLPKDVMILSYLSLHRRGVKLYRLVSLRTPTEEVHQLQLVNGVKLVFSNVLTRSFKLERNHQS